MKINYKISIGLLITTIVVLSIIKIKSTTTTLKQVEKEVSLIEYNKIVASKQKMTLVYFWADWCSVCVKMKPIIEQIEIEYSQKIQVLRIDSEKDKEITKEFEIDGLPILFLYKNGTIIWIYAGFIEKSMLKAQLDGTPK